MPQPFVGVHSANSISATLSSLNHAQALIFSLVMPCSKGTWTSIREVEEGTRCRPLDA